MQEWNEHRIRKQEFRQIAGGKPDLLYLIPEKYNAVERRKIVNLENVNLLMRDYINIEKPELCCPIFREMVRRAYPEFVTPSSSEAA